jgi:hypothetical protein
MFVYFTITNRSSIDLQFDRMLFDVSINEPLLHKSAILDRMPLARGARSEALHFACFLNPAQVDTIKRRVTAQGELNGFQVNVTAYFQASEGWIEVHKLINRSRVSVG